MGTHDRIPRLKEGGEFSLPPEKGVALMIPRLAILLAALICASSQAAVADERGAITGGIGGAAAGAAVGGPVGAILGGVGGAAIGNSITNHRHYYHHGYAYYHEYHHHHVYER
jgi:hypothetical protein